MLLKLRNYNLTAPRVVELEELPSHTVYTVCVHCVRSMLKNYHHLLACAFSFPLTTESIINTTKIIL